MLKVCNLGYEVIENGKKVTIVKDISFTVEDGEMLVKTLRTNVLPAEWTLGNIAYKNRFPTAFL